MTDPERELRRRFDSAVVGIEATAASRAAVLRRTRRRRLATAVLAGGVSAVLIAGAVLGGARFLGPPLTEKSEVAGSGPGLDYLEIPRGEEGIARGRSDGVAWSLSAPPDGSCLTLTLGRRGNVVGHGSCGGGTSPLDVTEIRYEGQVLVTGSVAPDVERVELRAAIGEDDELDTNVTLMDLYDAPDALATARRFFVAGIPRDSTFALLVAHAQEEAPVAHSVTLSTSSEEECSIEAGSGERQEGATAVHKVAEVERDLRRAARKILRSRASSSSSTELVVPAESCSVSTEVIEHEGRDRP